MALIKTKDEREIEMLKKVEHEIERQQRRRKRINQLLLAGIAVISVAAFIGGHLCGRHCQQKHFRP